MFPSRRATLGGDVFRDEYSLAFDGGTEYIEFPDVNDLGAGDFSIAVWVKAPDITNLYIVAKRDDAPNRWHLAINSSDYFYFWSAEDGSTRINLATSSTLTSLENTWMHLAVSADRDDTSAGISLYINGEHSRSGAASDDTIDNSGNFVIAASNTGPEPSPILSSR